jgi:outer membrane protein OmpA-like peptidoglycan-associated protein
MMRATRLSLSRIGLALALALSAGAARAQAPAPTRDDIVSKLNHFEEAAEVDLPALKQQVMERAKTRIRNDPGPVNRPLIAPDLARLPAFNAQIQFDADTPIIQPASYQTVGRIADALVHASLLPFTFLIVGHVESNSKTREANAILSQRRADAIRDVLVNTFKISAKRIQSIGLGEEQLLDRPRPTAAVNGQTQILTFSKIPDEQPDRPAAPTKPQPAKKPAKKR